MIDWSRALRWVLVSHRLWFGNGGFVMVVGRKSHIPSTRGWCAHNVTLNDGRQWPTADLGTLTFDTGLPAHRRDFLFVLGYQLRFIEAKPTLSKTDFLSLCTSFCSV